MTMTTRPRKTFTIEKFQGLNSNLMLDTYEPGTFRQATNFFMGFDDMSLLVRPGFHNPVETGFSSFPSAVFTCCVPYRDTAGVTTYLVSTSTKAYWIKAGGCVDLGAFPFVAGVQYLANVYLCRTGTTLAKFNGSTIAAVAGTPNLDYVVFCKDRCFGYGSGAPSTVYYSSVGDFETWPGANFFKIREGDGFQLSGLVSYTNDRLIIFKTGSMWIQYIAADLASWILSPLSEITGCISPFSIRVNHGLIYWLSHYGVYRSDANSEPQKISEPIHTGATFPLTRSLSTSIHGCSWGDNYIIWRAGTGTCVYSVYNVIHGNWYQWSSVYNLAYMDDIRDQFQVSTAPLTRYFQNIGIALKSGASVSTMMGLEHPQGKGGEFSKFRNYMDGGDTVVVATVVTNPLPVEPKDSYIQLLNMDVSVSGFAGSVTTTSQLDGVTITSVVSNLIVDKLTTIRVPSYSIGRYPSVSVILTPSTSDVSNPPNGPSYPVAIRSIIMDYLPIREFVSQVTSA